MNWAPIVFFLKEYRKRRKIPHPSYVHLFSLYAIYVVIFLRARQHEQVQEIMSYIFCLECVDVFIM